MHPQCRCVSSRARRLQAVLSAATARHHSFSARCEGPYRSHGSANGRVWNARPTVDRVPVPAATPLELGWSLVGGLLDMSGSQSAGSAVTEPVLSTEVIFTAERPR